MWATARRGPRAQPSAARRSSSSRIRASTGAAWWNTESVRWWSAMPAAIVGVGLARRETRATHRGEVGQHRAERRAGAGLAELRPARDRRMPEIVHTAW